MSLLDLLRRRGKVRPEELRRSHEELGCLYYSPSDEAFVEPTGAEAEDAVPHFGRPDGVLPRIVEEE